MSKSCAPYKNEEVWDNNDATYSHATHYTYDIHGNVNTLLQDNPNTGVAGQEFKRLDYAYDLISGNVNEVVYQVGQLDMMIHRYEYDSDNRITSVETSTDGVFYDNDAKYFYYAHGPLARTELGENQVQGLDYVYTLQGWIKGVNSNTLDTTRDVGQDGNRVVGNPNAYFAKDVFGYTLNYFAGDYTAINSTVSQTANNFEADKTNSDLLTSRKDFFNGNISAMVTTITNPTTGEVLPQGMAYDYDQLNRLLSAKAFVNLDMQTNTWQSGSTYGNRYYNAFTYDANGNILTQTRYAENGTQIEDLTYQYNRNTNGKMLQNRLYHVNDNVAATAFTDDIDDQGTFSNTNHNNTNNYSYDGEGRLVRDDAEEIASITWTVTGKVKEVIRTSGSTKKNLKFRYDAMGQRIAKEVYDSNNNWEKTTYYVRDPQGNVMGIYEKKNDAQTQQLSYKIAERNIYGSSMVGLVKSDVELIGASAPNGTNFHHSIGEKQYYEQNHLSNVISVVSDLKLAQDWNGDLVVDYYRAEIISVSDVFPYGSPMQERTINSTAVRHSFNGQEKDDEIYGEGNMTTAEFWQYDTRLGRRWNIDPIMKYWESGYSTFASNPTYYSDVSGLDAKPGPIGELIDKVDRALGQVFGRARVFDFYGRGRRKYVQMSEVRSGTSQRSSGTLNSSGPPTSLSGLSGQEVQDFLNNSAPTPSSVTFKGMNDLLNSQQFNNLPLFKSASALSVTMEEARLEFNAFLLSDQQLFFLNGNLVTDKFGRSRRPTMVSGKSTISVDLNARNPQAIVSTNVVTSNTNDRYTASINQEMSYRMHYAQIPIYRNFTQQENSNPEFLNGKVYDANGVIVGYQLAPPGTPGAKPLMKHSFRYIVRFTLLGSDGVNLSYGRNKALRTHNR